MRKALFALSLISTALCVAVIAWGQPAYADPGRGADVLCYVWANTASPPVGVPYSPSSFYSFNAVGRASANTITKTGAGQYTVNCKGVGGGALFSGSGTWGAGGHVQVTAYGVNASFCKVGGWGTGGSDFTATVNCYKAGFVLADSQFDLLFVW